ncbi:hypothetical protein KBX18_01785 [Corynebacterium sp. CCUG 69979]|uniref:histidine kinase n=1 Tax=Corynebacterium sp. CCUG 69979 TaxID=2823890 RepID=UPI00210E9DBA|nr:histidine kinase [Corynebacterium sp. CCUG 69979]MCQ4619118.1 hypothetical protein [Corynebacterium pseudogenitalium]MCQ4624302.1 hypothetical protein [Corynebacterium sp. CCUG 69979]
MPEKVMFVNDANRNELKSPRTFMDKLLEAWHSSTETLWLGALAGLGFQLMLSVFSLRAYLTSWVMWALVTAVQFALLVARRRWPLYALAGQSVIFALGETLTGSGAYSLVPFLICVASVVLRDRSRNVLIGIGMAVASSLVSTSGLHSGRGPQLEAMLPVLWYLAVAIALTAFARGRLNSLAERDRRLVAEQREREAAARQRKAESVSRVASNLHDSVGHNLTGIITLAEGISKQSGNEQVDGVVDLVNELAREALGETRTAIRAIKSAETEEHDVLHPSESARTWEDISQLIGNVRSTGLDIAVTERGQRPENPRIQDTLYRVVRESLTNVMQHARDATAVTITFAFTQCGVEVTLTDNGTVLSPSTAPGVGLDGLAMRVQQAGGTFNAGWAENGWKVRATLPLEDGDPQ